MLQELAGLRIAILVEDAFEQVEMTGPRDAFIEAGAEMVLISPHEGRVQGWNGRTPGEQFSVEMKLSEAQTGDFNGLLLPGGVLNADALRTNPQAVEFVRGFAQEGKPIAAICHAPWMLVEADLVRDRNLTSWPSLQTDIRNAGGNWLDRMVVEDGPLVTSRKPDDIAAFNVAAIAVFAAARPVSARLLEN